MATPFPDIPISQSSTRTTTRDMIIQNLGNGNEQRFPRGLNYQRDIWQVQWNGMTTFAKDTVESFLQSISDGSVATWTSPFDSTQKKFVLVGDYALSDNGGVIYSISATFRQVYDSA